MLIAYTHCGLPLLLRKGHNPELCFQKYLCNNAIGQVHILTISIYVQLWVFGKNNIKMQI